MADYSKYSTILFMDSMVALEGKPLPKQPWAQIDPTGPILILVVPQVSTEIDKRKRDGRLGTRARAFNNLVGKAATSGAPFRIVEGVPAVDIGIASTGKLNWDGLDDLDPDDPDARIVVQILHARDVPEAKKLLLSQDINPISMAARHGIKAVRLPDHWLLSPEPSPSEKEATKLKHRVAQLEATAPDMDFEVEFFAPQPLTLYKVRPLTPAQRSSLAAEIIAKNPRMNNARGQLSHVFGYDDEYNEKYERWRDVLVDRYVETLHRNLEIWYDQYPLSITIKNGGHVQAENLIVSMRVSNGARLNDKFATYSPYGPITPKPDPNRSLVRPYIPDISSFRTPVIGRHEIDFARGPNRCDVVEIHCQDFRHGHNWSFDGFVTLDPADPGPLVLTVKATAANLKGSVTKTFELPYVVEELDISDLIDPIERKRIKDCPAEALINEAIKTKNRDLLQFLDFDKHWSELSGKPDDRRADDDDDY